MYEFHVFFLTNSFAVLMSCYSSHVGYFATLLTIALKSISHLWIMVLNKQHSHPGGMHGGGEGKGVLGHSLFLSLHKIVH